MNFYLLLGGALFISWSYAQVQTTKMRSCLIGEILNQYHQSHNSAGFRAESELIRRPSIAGMKSFQSPNGIFTFHYTTERSSPHAISPTATRLANIPDYILTMSDIFTQVYEEFQKLGYARPPSDGSAGGSSSYDVYVINIETHLNREGNRSIYGLCIPEQTIGDNPFTTAREIKSTTSWMAMQNTYSWVRNSRLSTNDLIRVTATHEFFHAIQFGYSSQNQNDLYFIEGTAVAIEEQLFPTIEDYFQYLNSFYPNINGVSLFTNGNTDTRFPFHHYGVWLYFKRLSEIYGNNTILQILEEFRTENKPAIQHIKKVLKNKGSSFEKSLEEFALANALQFDFFFNSTNTFSRARDYYNYYTNHCLRRSNANVICANYSIFTTLEYNSSSVTWRTGQQLDTLWMPASADFYKIRVDTVRNKEFFITVTPYEANRQMSAFMLLNTKNTYQYLQADFSSRYYYTFHIPQSSNFEDYTLVVLRHDADSSVLSSRGYQIHVGSSILKIDSNQSEKIFTVFPNPTGDKLLIQFDGEPIEFIRIYSVDGTILKQISWESDSLLEICVSDLSSGTYLISLHSHSHRYIKRFTKI
ncbi:MAG: T9SS type A sorting domain-containing protein [Cytophagales bacterium]|nr:T9SS type A sorting domain-containing protein [Cytophagales bacterium]MDW8384071.1 T9SS type A sorting domain-containing protein [Flammeovirgaceae bacterium]